MCVCTNSVSYGKFASTRHAGLICNFYATRPIYQATGRHDVSRSTYIGNPNEVQIKSVKISNTTAAWISVFQLIM